MRILVTGVGGCLGRYVAVELAERGHDVVGVIRTREPAGLRTRIELVQSELSTGSGLPSRYDAVFHAAATSPAPGVSTSAMTVDNVDATRALVRHSERAGAKCFINCSSLSLYGRIVTSIVDERTPVSDPDVYGQTKLLAEALLAETSIPSISIRLPAVLGRGATRNFLATTAQKLLLGQPVSIFNPASSFNNAVHSIDIASFASSLLTQSWHGHRVVVVSARGFTTVRNCVERLRVKLGSRSEIQSSRSQKRAFLIDSTMAQERLGYSPMDILDMMDLFARDILADRGSH